MKPTLSICIPTLNRPELLLQSLNSIFFDPSLLGQLEICISNNGSEADYQAVEDLLAAYSEQCTIKYVRHSERIPLDKNHHFATSLATADYLHLLGDDDFFLRDELRSLLDLIATERPDLAIFNGYQIDDANRFLGPHFTLLPRTYDALEPAFRDLKDKGSFGSVLVRRELLKDADFESLYNTDHAYGCYWLSLFRKHDRGETTKIMVPDFPCVALRAARKSYSHIDVYYNKIPRWMAIHQDLLKTSPLRHLVDENAAETHRFNASLRFLVHLGSTGYDLGSIKKADQAFYDRYRMRLWLARRLAGSLALRAARRLYRGAVKGVGAAGAQQSTAQMAYKLSSATGPQR
jgi:glycosyltransferase involved in cell wall biosynthesis